MAHIKWNHKCELNMDGKNYTVFVLGLLTVLTISLMMIPADASKSQGTSISIINSKQVCGDVLCSYSMSISEKIDLFFKNNMDSDDTMFFQQGVSFFPAKGTLSESDFVFNTVIKSVNVKSKLDFSNVKHSSLGAQKILKLSNVIKSVNLKSKLDFSNTKQSISLGAQNIMKLSEIKKLIDSETPNITMKIDSKLSKSIKTLTFNLDKNISVDVKNMKLKLKYLSGKDSKNIVENSVNVKHSDEIEKLKDKKIKIKKTK